MWPMKMTSSTTRTKSLILMRMMGLQLAEEKGDAADRKSTRLNSSHLVISYAVFCLKKKNERRSHRAVAGAEKVFGQPSEVAVSYGTQGQVLEQPKVSDSQRH